jgi:hypothetical protein
MDAWRQYLFRTHSESTIRDWARRLSLFRFVRAAGGHANDGDSLEVLYRYANLDELMAFVSRLGITLVHYARKPAQPSPGVSYDGAEFARFPALIPGSGWIEQPGHRELAGQPVFIWCEIDTVRISLHEGYEVTDAVVSRAEQVEQVLAHVVLDRIDPPVDGERCVCPKYYPDYLA